MPFTTWLRDALGIRKDVIDTKKAKLEITKLEAEERERNLITPASLDDVKKYDLKYQALIERAREREMSVRMLIIDPRLERDPSPHSANKKWVLMILLLALLGLALLLFALLRNRI
jgi:hypothetical protein